MARGIVGAAVELLAMGTSLELTEFPKKKVFLTLLLGLESNVQQRLLWRLGQPGTTLTGRETTRERDFLESTGTMPLDMLRNCSSSLSFFLSSSSL